MCMSGQSVDTQFLIKKNAMQRDCNDDNGLPLAEFKNITSSHELAFIHSSTAKMKIAY